MHSSFNSIVGLLVYQENGCFSQHPVGRTLISNLSLNSFIMVVYEKIFLVIWTENSG